jgi:hypothetical protein
MSRLQLDMILERDSLLLDGVGDHAAELLDIIEMELERCGLDETSRWTRALERLDRRGRPDVREFIVVTHRGLPELAHWISCRPTGIHLEVLTMTVIASSEIKRRLAAPLFDGEWWRFSMPRGLAQEEAIRIWLTTLHEVVGGSAKALMRRLAGGNAAIAPAARDPLAEW